MGSQFTCCDRNKHLKLEFHDHPFDTTPISQYLPTKEAKDKLNEIQMNNTNQKIFNLAIFGDEPIKKFKNIDAIYKGQYQNGIPHGKGYIIFRNGSIGKGTFERGKFHGEDCQIIFSDGSLYQGSIHNNIIQGEGTFQSHELKYKGFWKNNLPHGEGEEIYKNNDTYKGNFRHGLKNCQKGTYVWHAHKEYETYIGHFVNNQMKGHGKLILKNGTEVVGHFEQKQIKNATLSNRHYKYEGSIKNGHLFGQGKLKLIDTHETYVGNFIEGKMQGHFSITNSKKRKIDAYIHDQKKFIKIHRLDKQQIEKIVNLIQKIYQQNNKHQEAIQQINQQLKSQFHCYFANPFDLQSKAEKYLFIEIFQKILCCEKKQ